MSNNIPSAPERHSEQPHFFEVLPGFPALVKSKDLSLTKKLELLDGKGKLIAEVKKNIPGNPSKGEGFVEKSYTLLLNSGEEILLPVPYFYNTANFFLDVKENEDIEISISQASAPVLFTTNDAEPKDISSIQPKVVDFKELTTEWQEIVLEDDQDLVFYNDKKDILSRVYKVSHAVEYIFRDPQGNAREHFFEGDEIATANQKIYFQVKKGKLQVKGEIKLAMGIERFVPYQKIETSADGFLQGVVNGGRQIVLASYREVGRVKEEMTERNEDNGGFNTDTVVIADGIGGSLHGALASSRSVESVLQAKGNLKEVVRKAHEDMETYTSQYKILVEEKAREQQERVENAWFDQQQPPKPNQKGKPLNTPDAVMAAVRFEGDMLKIAILGDSKVYVIRGDEIVYESKEHTYVAQQVALGKMTPREALKSPFSSIIITTVASSFHPDYGEFHLKKGDRILLCSDGGKMPKHLMIQCVKDKNAELGVHDLMQQKYHENEIGAGYYDVGDDNEDLVAVSSLDNTSYALIVHD